MISRLRRCTQYSQRDSVVINNIKRQGQAGHVASLTAGLSLHHKLLVILLGSLVAWVSAATPSLAREFEVDRSQTVFAMLTHKGGIARALAHNHIVVPTDYKATIAGEIEQASDGSINAEGALFTLVFPAAALSPDLPAMQARWYPRVKATGLLDEAFPSVSVSDRTKIKATMLSDEQLAAAQYPDISAELVSLKVQPSLHGEQAFTHEAVMALRLHGREVRAPFAVRLTREGDNGLQLEGVGRYRFTDFGIKPFSALGGTIRNLDEFDIYVQLRAKAVGGAE